MVLAVRVGADLEAYDLNPQLPQTYSCSLLPALLGNPKKAKLQNELSDTYLRRRQISTLALYPALLGQMTAEAGRLNRNPGF
jgi:hypothetical protein